MDRSYEIIFVVHPDHSSEVPKIIDRCRSVIENGGGKITHTEDRGYRHFRRPVHKVQEAYFVLMKVACDSETIEELVKTLSFIDVVLMTLSRDKTRVHSPHDMRRINSELNLTTAENPLVLKAQLGKASPNDLADLFHELSTLYRMVGGSGIHFFYEESKEFAESFV